MAPPGFEGTYIEPFVGGGSVFFALAPARAVLADLNTELVVTYQAVRDRAEDIIEILRKYPHDRAFFQRLRKERPRAPQRVAARLVYLNKTAFNGMYRVNRRGEFNVPFGSYANPTTCPADRLRSAQRSLADVEIAHADFEVTARAAAPGDWVFFDPPFITGHQNNGFHKYNARLFTWHDQERLAALSHELRTAGVHVLLSNADHGSIRALYPGWQVTRVVRNSLINSSAARRGAVTELLISSYPLFSAIP